MYIFDLENIKMKKYVASDMKISPIKVNEIQLQFGVMKEILLDKKKPYGVCNGH